MEERLGTFLDKFLYEKNFNTHYDDARDIMKFLIKAK